MQNATIKGQYLINSIESELKAFCDEEERYDMDTKAYVEPIISFNKIDLTEYVEENSSDVKSAFVEEMKRCKESEGFTPIEITKAWKGRLACRGILNGRDLNEPDKANSFMNKNQRMFTS